MWKQMMVSLAALVVIGLSVGRAQTPPALATTITVPDMHCMACAKKMGAQLQAVAGVNSVQANVQATALLVSAKPGAVPSPRGMWEAVEKAGYKPSRLEGAAGTFTSKPQS